MIFRDHVTGEFKRNTVRSINNTDKSVLTHESHGSSPTKSSSKSPHIKTTCLRFNTKKPMFRRAWEILQSDDRSYSKLIAQALIEYHERHSKLADDPYFETREREEKFADQIVSAVSEKIENAMPRFLSACFARLSQPYRVPPTASNDTNNTRSGR